MVWRFGSPDPNWPFARGLGTPVHHQAAANIYLLYLCKFKAKSNRYQQGNEFYDD